MTKRMRGLWLACSLLPLVACMAKDEAGSTAAPRLDSSEPGYVAGEYIVTAKSKVSAETISRVYAALGIEKVHNLRDGRYLLRLSPDPGLERVRTTGIESGLIGAVQRNFLYRNR